MFIVTEYAALNKAWYFMRIVCYKRPQSFKVLRQFFQPPYTEPVALIMKCPTREEVIEIWIATKNDTDLIT